MSLVLDFWFWVWKVIYVHCTKVNLSKENYLSHSLTLFLPAKGGISPYMSVMWPSPVGIGLKKEVASVEHRLLQNGFWQIIGHKLSKFKIFFMASDFDRTWLKCSQNLLFSVSQFQPFSGSKNFVYPKIKHHNRSQVT